MHRSIKHLIGGVITGSLLMASATPAELSINKEKHRPNDELLFHCSYTASIDDDDCIPDNFGSFSGGNLSMATVLNKILGTLRADSTTKITSNFITYECSFPQPIFKAITKKADSTRYILYTKRQLDELMSTNTNWVAYSIFSHEIAHHLYGHSLSNPKGNEQSRMREMQADFFCGYVMRKLQATLAEAQSGINVMDNHPTDLQEVDWTHPTKAKRLLAVQAGYEFFEQPNSTTRALLNTDSLRTVKGLEQIFNKSLEAFFEKDLNKAMALLNQLDKAWKGKNRADYFNIRGVIKREAGDKEGALKDFDKAIEINRDKSEFFFNRSDIKKESPNKTIRAEGIEDVKQAKQLKAIEKARGF